VVSLVVTLVVILVVNLVVTLVVTLVLTLRSGKATTCDLTLLSRCKMSINKFVKSVH
jgi:hypothetical protein